MARRLAQAAYSEHLNSWREGTDRTYPGSSMIMHVPFERDTLLKQADDAIATARRLQNELCETRAAAHAQCRCMEHWETLQFGLYPAVAISLRVRARVSEQGVK